MLIVVSTLYRLAIDELSSEIQNLSCLLLKALPSATPLISMDGCIWSLPPIIYKPRGVLLSTRTTMRSLPIGSSSTLRRFCIRGHYYETLLSKNKGHMVSVCRSLSIAFSSPRPHLTSNHHDTLPHLFTFTYHRLSKSLSGGSYSHCCRTITSKNPSIP